MPWDLWEVRFAPPLSLWDASGLVCMDHILPVLASVFLSELWHQIMEQEAVPLSTAGTGAQWSSILSLFVFKGAYFLKCGALWGTPTLLIWLPGAWFFCMYPNSDRKHWRRFFQDFHASVESTDYEITFDRNRESKGVFKLTGLIRPCFFLVLIIWYWKVTTTLVELLALSFFLFLSQPVY